MILYINVIGSARNEGYDLPAYVDFAIRGRMNWPKDGSVKRVRLPRSVFRKTHLFKIGR